LVEMAGDVAKLRMNCSPSRPGNARGTETCVPYLAASCTIRLDMAATCLLYDVYVSGDVFMIWRTAGGNVVQNVCKVQDMCMSLY
jgi:hypothetical protein